MKNWGLSALDGTSFLPSLGEPDPKAIATAIIVLLSMAIVSLTYHRSPTMDATTNAAIAAVLCLVIGGAIVAAIWWTDWARLVAGILLGLCTLGLVLRLWGDERFGSIAAWTGGVVLLTITYTLVTLIPWWPLNAGGWSILLAPPLAAAVIGSIIGLPLQASIKAQNARRAELHQLRIAQALAERQAKEDADKQAADELQAEQTRLAEASAQMLEDEIRARATASTLDATHGQWSPEAQSQRRFILCRLLYEARRGRPGHAIKLAVLAGRAGLTAEQTLAAVIDLETRGLVRTNRQSPERRTWSDFYIQLSDNGVHKTEQESRHMDGGIHIYSGAQVGQVGQHFTGDNTFHFESSTAASLQQVIDALTVVRGDLDARSAGTLDGHMAELTTASTIPEKRSALERLRGFIIGLGAVGEPILKLINGSLDVLKNLQS